MNVNKKIKQITSGRSFADVGGLWGTENERVTVASLAGACSATMVDMQREDNEWWQAFDQHCEEKGVTDYGKIVANIDDADFTSRVPSHDIVHCSGVIYHSPNPLRTMAQLRAITANTLLLCSMTVPERMKTKRGVIELPEGHMLSVPALGDRERTVVASYFDRIGIQVHNINMSGAVPWRVEGDYNYAPWWWLWTPKTLARLVETAGFSVCEKLDD